MIEIFRDIFWVLRKMCKGERGRGEEYKEEYEELCIYIDVYICIYMYMCF